MANVGEPDPWLLAPPPCDRCGADDVQVIWPGATGHPLARSGVISSPKLARCGVCGFTRMVRPEDRPYVRGGFVDQGEEFSVPPSPPDPSPAD